MHASRGERHTRFLAALLEDLSALQYGEVQGIKFIKTNVHIKSPEQAFSTAVKHLSLVTSCSVIFELQPQTDRTSFYWCNGSNVELIVHIFVNVW